MQEQEVLGTISAPHISRTLKWEKKTWGFFRCYNWVIKLLFSLSFTTLVRLLFSFDWNWITCIRATHASRGPQILSSAMLIWISGNNFQWNQGKTRTLRPTNCGDALLALNCKTLVIRNWKQSEKCRQDSLAIIWCNLCSMPFNLFVTLHSALASRKTN